jgi:hypothetical protein
VVATGPAEMAEIVGKTAAQGFKGQFVGSVPTYNPALLKSEAAPAIKALYHFVAPWGPWGSDTPAHKAMQEAAGGKAPANDGYTFGWVWSYPLKAVTVDYEGALPPKSYNGEPNETAMRQAVIAKPDESAPLGSSVLKDFFVGPTAEKFDFSKPCVAAG